MMKRKIKILVAVIIISCVSLNLYAQDSNQLSYGVKIMAGGRYDNMRMCVGSDKNVKGGPIADIMFLANYKLSSGRKLTFELPVMRPILFGAAFKMLQFEPEISMEFVSQINQKKSIVIAPGMGLSLHYGPDYKSDLDNRGDDFFAAGPFFSTLVGLKKINSINKDRIMGIRFFYTPLFSSESDLSPGTILGAAFEMQFGF